VSFLHWLAGELVHGMNGLHCEYGDVYKSTQSHGYKMCSPTIQHQATVPQDASSTPGLHSSQRSWRTKF